MFGLTKINLIIADKEFSSAIPKIDDLMFLVQDTILEPIPIIFGGITQFIANSR